jgi:hypothetical protein
MIHQSRVFLVTFSMLFFGLPLAFSVLEANARSAFPDGKATTQVVVLDASQDNTLIETVSQDGSMSNGMGAHFYAGRVGDKDDRTLRRGAIVFDVGSEIGAGSTIKRVTLTLSMSKTQAGPFRVELHRLNASWGEGGSQTNTGAGAASATGDATWIHRFFDSVVWQSPGGDFSGVVSDHTLVAEPGKYSWGSTPQMVADVQSWLDDPSGSFGWVVIGDESRPLTSTVKQFDSRENQIADNRPKLAVEFEPLAVATPTPRPVTLEDVDTNEDGTIDHEDLLNVLRFWMETAK